MSNADRLAGYLADFKKENKSSVSISMGGGDDESDTANLLGWASSGFDKLKNKVSKVQENIPIPNPLKRKGFKMMIKSWFKNEKGFSDKT